MDTLLLRVKFILTTLLLGICRMFEPLHWTERIAFVIGVGVWVAFFVCWLLGIN